MSELHRARTITSDLVGAAMVFRAKILGAAIFAGLSPLFVTSPPPPSPAPTPTFLGEREHTRLSLHPLGKRSRKTILRAHTSQPKIFPESNHDKYPKHTLKFLFKNQNLLMQAVS
jgi:hypothetical protein